MQQSASAPELPQLPDWSTIEKFQKTLEDEQQREEFATIVRASGAAKPRSRPKTSAVGFPKPLTASYGFENRRPNAQEDPIGLSLARMNANLWGNAIGAVVDSRTPLSLQRSDFMDRSFERNNDLSRTKILYQEKEFNRTRDAISIYGENWMQTKAVLRSGVSQVPSYINTMNLSDRMTKKA
jgi:hypothetical protein